MAEITLSEALPLGGLDVTIGGTRLRERGDLGLVSVSVPQGGTDALAEVLQSAFGLEMPEARRIAQSETGGIRAVSLTPDQILLVLPEADHASAQRVEAQIGEAGYTSVQTGGWVVLELRGPRAGAALERLCPLDLGAEAFGPDASARTVMEHMSVTILREGEGWLLLAASSSARSFAHAVETAMRSVA